MACNGDSIMRMPQSGTDRSVNTLHDRQIFRLTYFHFAVKYK